MINTNAHYIIAIGASAGGIEEIHRFFDNTPLDSVSYVIIQHLSSDFKSRMVELLDKHSKLKVKEAEDDMLIDQNVVYFIPNNKYMTISEGRLHLTDKEKMKRPHLTIDAFLNSLATACGDKAIAVILSGSGSDGSEGVKAVKKAGGMVIARNPSNAEFGSMPSNAVATGAVDYTLEPEEIPETKMNYVKNEGKLLVEKSENEAEKQIIKDIIDWIKTHLPVDFSDYKPGTLYRRIKRRAILQNFNELEKYLSFLKTDPIEVQALAKDFLISVTAFFRDKEAFKFIETNVIPDIIKNNPDGKEIKLWVSGCATGEEAYSLAILMYEQLINQYEHTEVKIFATDLDSTALAHAGRGVYTENAVKNISAERIEMFFSKEGDDYKVKPQLRKMLIFAQHDLVKNAPYCNMNFISCRNLLIYMSPVLQKKILQRLHFGLKENGYLFLGVSENFYPEEATLELINPKWKIYKNTEASKHKRFDAFSLPSLIDTKALPVTRGLNKQPERKNTNVTDSVIETLVRRLNYLVVCIDKNNQVVQTYGDTTKYLLQKNFTSDLEELLTKPLNIAFNVAKAEALQTGKEAVIKGIKANYNLSTAVKLNVTLLTGIKGEQKLLMVIFSDDNASNNVDAEGKMFDASAFINHYTQNIEKELKEIKEKLALSDERLDASVENIYSFNEELLSSNEEMQSSNEEMQSLIEELHTINKDYQLKNKELTEINDDLNNYFRSNQNGQLFVNMDLQLIKFSPGTVKHINLIDSDIGRPISSISTNIKFDTLINDMKDVIMNGETITRDTEATNGKWYQLKTMPYIRQADNTIAGAIITFSDITELKETQNNLDKANKTLRLINSDLNNFVYSASHDLLGPIGNIESIIALTKQVKTSENEMAEYIEMIDSSVKKFRSLVREMAAVGKIENEMFVLEAVNISSVIEEIKLSIADKIASTHTIITLDFKEGEIFFSKKNLRSILYNLITNAIKYKSDRRDPVILISTRKEQDNVILTVKDNGIGIEQDKISKIFNLYSRVKKDVEGQGIGLYLTKKIIDAAGGIVALESNPGEGSVFTLYFNTQSKSASLPTSM